MQYENQCLSKVGRGISQDVGALLQVTEARKESSTVAEQCKQLLQVWDTSEEFRGAMVSPVLEPEAKKRALQSLLGEQVTPSLMNLLKVLADRQRLQAFDAVMQRFLELYREQQGITLAEVRSAQALSAAISTQLCCFLSHCRALLSEEPPKTTSVSASTEKLHSPLGQL